MINAPDDAFKKIYKEAPLHTFFAPGQVNFLGEQSACNGGSSLSAAISHGTWLLISPNEQNKFVLRMLNEDDYAEVLVSPHYRSTNIEWVNYPLSVISRFTQETGVPLSGLNMLFSGNVPQGIGLSSSASMEMVTAFALDHIFGGRLGKGGLVKMALASEPGFVDEDCAGAGQYTVTFGEKNRALLFDGTSLTHRTVPCKLDEYALLLIDTGRSRPGAAVRWNERLEQCQQALAILQQENPMKSLCELTPSLFEQQAHLITDPVIVARARHVIEENARVQQAAMALQKGDPESFGQLLSDSHASLRQLYELTSREQDLVVEISQREGVAGARMTEARSGGSVLALVHQAELKNYRAHLIREYRKATGTEPTVLRIRTGPGASRLQRG